MIGGSRPGDEMPASDRRYSSRRWARVRRSILFRDEHRCQLLGPKCKGKADCVDHIISPLDGGDFWDPTNLRAACTTCNSSRGAADGNRRRALTKYRPSRNW